MIDVVLLGTGNIATYLFEAFSTSNKIRILQVYNHSQASLTPFKEKVSTTIFLEKLKKADLYILAVKDDVIPKMAAALSNLNGLVVHTSGAVSLEALKQCQHSGVFYPLQTFSKAIPAHHRDIPFCLETERQEDLELLKTIVHKIGGKAYQVTSGQRKKLHLAAVFVCNFVNHLYAIGEEICLINEIPFEILQPLILETAQNLSHASPRKLQTGPAKRNDLATIQTHLKSISNKEHKEIYQLLTHAIQTDYGKKL